MVVVPETTIVKKGRMGPGQMIAVDLAEGVIYDDHEIKDQIAGERPYSELIKDFMTVGDLADQPSALAAWDKAELTRRQVAANMTREAIDRKGVVEGKGGRG